MPDKSVNPKNQFTPNDILDIFDRAARAVTDLKDGESKGADSLLDIAALAIKGEALAWCEEQGEMGLALFEQRYNAILCKER